MNKKVSEQRKDKLKQSNLYLRMQKITLLLDQYHLDGAIGLIPGGIGDMVTALFSLVHVYFSLFKLRSIPLTLAILNNSLRDIFMGLIPFYVGDVIDFFHRSNKKNMQLIDGFVNHDSHIISEINRKAVYSLLVFISLLIAIGLMIWLIITLIGKLGTVLFT
ncbi:DUF4112 domain-containing protein [Prevotella sp.]|uniref:DUF4112 domain-containing protein n=1 Tax=Prevotella sp. TaxID=59823 RepID=UPI002F93AAA1